MIDDNSYEHIASYYYQSLSQGTRYYLEQNRSRQVRQQELRIQFAKDYFSKISFRFNNLEEFIYFENNLEKDFMANSASASYQDVLRVKKNIFEGRLFNFS